MPTVSVNTHFPGYEIIGELGRSNARVLKARHLATGDLVAIKHFTLHTDAETLRRFRVEAQIMTNTRHPNVVRVREVQLDMALPFIVMEWVEGGNLRTLIDGQGNLSVATTIRLGLQMAEAFNAIHPQGIIHRDIKPENILYRPLPSGELHFLLTDFGVARLREQTQTLTGQSLMTYEYASPEQFDNPKGVTVATDYYSLGIVLYECLAGKVPFPMADTAGLALFMRQVLHAAPSALTLPPGQYLPPSLNTLVNWALVKNPADRLSDVTELALLLGQASVEQLQANRSGNRQASIVPRIQTRTASAPTVQPIKTHEPTVEREPIRSTNGLSVLLSLLVVGLLIGLAVFYTNRPEEVHITKAVPDSTVTSVDSLTQNDVTTTSTPVPFAEPDEETSTDSLTTAPATPPDTDSTMTNDTPIATDSTDELN